MRRGPENPDLILTGLQSDDLGYGQTGVVLAELMGLPHSTIIMQVEVNGASIRVKRELEDGWFQHIAMPLPAVLTIQSGINKLRYATLMGIKRAKTKEIRRVSRGARTARLQLDAHRETLPAGKAQAGADFRRRSQGRRREAGGETEIRGAGFMKSPRGSRTPERPAAPHVLGDAGGGAADRRRTSKRRVVGSGIGALAQEVASKKLARVYAVEHALLENYTADGYTAAVEALIRKTNPDLVLFPHTYQTRDFAPKLATRFDRSLISDVIAARVES